jgi:DNA-binding NarL/FixJ family response regulator
MHGIGVALLSEDRERLTTLKDRLQATRLGREVFSHLGFPVSPTDTIIRQLQESRAEVVIIDVPSQSAPGAIRAIELIRATTQIAIFASGEITQPANIVATMRNGASEYVDRSGGHEALLEALTRFSALRTRALGAARRLANTLIQASALARIENRASIFDRMGNRVKVPGFTLLRAGNGYVVLKDEDKCEK